MINNISKNNQFQINYEYFISNLKRNQFKKICVCTGAGISVAAGIPDFRSPKSGIYANLEKYNLPYAEAIFDIEYFQHNQKPFYQFCLDYFKGDFKPTKGHLFIKQLQNEKMLLYNFTQNIDGLERKVGISDEFLVEAHGNVKNSTCMSCGFCSDDINKFFNTIQKNQLKYQCEKCGSSLVKPNIVFFGENLPIKFYQTQNKISQSDLLIVMGTSLQVFPFASLIQGINQNTPIVIINKELPDSIYIDKNILFLQGDIEDSIKKIIQDLNWKLD